MKVLVCGGRYYDDEDLVNIVLDRIHGETPITAIVHGGAQGADYLGGLWARKHGIKEIVYRAQWGLHGRAAGPIRNQEMLDKEKPDMVLAFPGGKGTADMRQRAITAQIRLDFVRDRKRDS